MRSLIMRCLLPEPAPRNIPTETAMALKRTSTFVLDVAEHETFVFEADHASAAKDLVRESWFVAALEDFCTKRRVACNPRALHPRPATAMEAALFDERVSEFPEVLDRVLVVRLRAS